MPCSCANKPGNKYVPRSDTSDTDEYDHLMQSCPPRSDYSGRSSQKYENSSTLDDQAWNTLSSFRQKACRFLTSETEETPTDPLAAQCPYPSEFGYGGNTFITAYDLIDYTPQSEFLRKMKEKCQLLCSNLCSSLGESLRNDPYDCQMPNESPRMGENSYNSQACARVRFSHQEANDCDDEMLYENSSYDHNCSADEKLLDGLIDKTDPNKKRPKSANKKSEHVSRSKKPSRCRGRRKRKSSSPEKCESENQFEPTLKKPHENSCERCWRYASPARSPVNKPDQKFDPNFRRGHSCYDFEGGDAEFYDLRVSPCKNLQPITSREKQQSSETPAASTLEARQLSSGRRTPDTERRSLSLGRQRTPEAQSQICTPALNRSRETPPLMFTPPSCRSPAAQPQALCYQSPRPQPQSISPTCQQTPGPQFQSISLPYQDSQNQAYNFCQESPDSPPQRGISLWHKSPEPQPQSFSPSYHQCPDPMDQTYNPCQESQDFSSQRSIPTWQKSPRPQPQRPMWQKCSEVQQGQVPQSQMYKTPRQKTPEPQPQSFPSSYQQNPFHTPYQQSPDSQNQTYNFCQESPDSPPQRSISIWQKCPRPQSLSSYFQPLEPLDQTYNSCQESPDFPSQRSIPTWQKSPRPQSPMWQKCSEALQGQVPQSQTCTNVRQKTPEPQSQMYKTPEPQPQLFAPQNQYNFCQESPESPPQRGVSLWHKSPRPQSFSPSYHQSPDPMDQAYNLSQSQNNTTYTRWDSPPQRGVSLWKKSPRPRPQNPMWQKSSEALQGQVPQFQTCTNVRQKTPEPQPQQFTPMYRQSSGPQNQPYNPCQKSPVPQPQAYATARQKTPEPQSFSSACPQFPENLPQRCASPRPKSPRPQPQISTWQKSSEVLQGQVPQQRPQVQRSRSPAAPRETDYCLQSPRSPERGVYLNTADCRIRSTAQTHESRGFANSSLSGRPCGSTSQPSAGEKIYSPRHLTPPRPCPVSLKTIPEAVDESCKCKTTKSEKSSPKTVKENSSKSPARQGTSKRDSMGRSSSKLTPSRRSKSPNKSSSRSSPNKTSGGSSQSKSSKSPNRCARSGNGSTKKSKPKPPSPKPGSSAQQVRTPPQKSPQKSPKTDAKKTRSLDDASSRTPCTPSPRPQSSDPRREVSPRKDQTCMRAPQQYPGLDHEMRECLCNGPSGGPSGGGNRLTCCHCDWENLPNAYRRRRPRSSSEGFEGRVMECPHRPAGNRSADQPLNGTVNSSFERDCRLLSELQNTPSFDETFQGMSPIWGSPRKYFMLYMTKSKENKGDDDVEVLVEELTQACPSKTDSRTKDLTDKMKKIMECPSDSMALRFQKGVSDQCKIPQSSRVLYF